MNDVTELIKNLEYYLHLSDAPIGRSWSTFIDKQTLKDVIDVLKWNKGQPNKNGRYLVRKKSFMGNYYYTTILSWANNLYEIDNYDFYNHKNECGWYDYDSEYGHYKVSDEHIVEWKEIV